MSRNLLPLTCSANTLRCAKLPTRVAAASAAGFTGVGLRLADYVDGGLSDAELLDLLIGNSLRILELEHTWDWASGGLNLLEATLFRLADRVGFRQLNVPMFAVHSLRDLVRPFAELCDRAAGHGVLVGLEFIPYGHVRTIGEAWEVVRAAGRPNGGIIIDLWHWLRSGATTADLVGIPASAVTSVQMCDVLPQPSADPADEARHRRLLPGCGAGDIPTVLRGLQNHGIAAPVSVEVFSDDLDALCAYDAARLAFGAAADTLARAGLSAVRWNTNLEARAGECSEGTANP